MFFFYQWKKTHTHEKSSNLKIEITTKIYCRCVIVVELFARNSVSSRIFVIGLCVVGWRSCIRVRVYTHLHVLADEPRRAKSGKKKKRREKNNGNNHITELLDGIQTGRTHILYKYIYIYISSPRIHRSALFLFQREILICYVYKVIVTTTQIPCIQSFEDERKKKRTKKNTNILQINIIRVWQTES